MNVLIQKNTKTIFLVVLLIKLFVLMINLLDQLFYRGENAAYEFIKATAEEYEYCKKIMEECFNKSFIITEEEDLLQKSKNCWICKKFISNDES